MTNGLPSPSYLPPKHTSDPYLNVCTVATLSKGQSSSQARGIHSPADRTKLIEMSGRSELASSEAATPSATPDEGTDGAGLPGVETLWELQQGAAVAEAAAQRVVATSHRLVQLFLVRCFM